MKSKNNDGWVYRLKADDLNKNNDCSYFESIYTLPIWDVNE